MARVIKTKAWAERDTVAHAKSLLGRLLVKRESADGVATRVRITETEAYDGPDDLACHASKGRTARTEVMFGEAGRWYVYLCYGVHEMLNLVTGPVDYPAAVLVRGVESISGPGRLTKHLGIDRRFNRMAADRTSGLWIEDDGYVVSPDRITVSPRIGVDYAGPQWAAKPWRFVLRGLDSKDRPKR